MGSAIDRHFRSRPPATPPRATGLRARSGPVVLGLLVGLLRFILALVVDVALVLVRLLLWVRWVFLWLGVIALITALANHVMAPGAWHSQLAGGIGSVGLIAISRAPLLLDIRLRTWQHHLHRWA